MNDLTVQIDWDAIFAKFGDDEQTVVKSRAAVMLACGESRASVSRALDIPETQIKAWTNEDPNFRSVLSTVKNNVLVYLEQQLPNKIFKADKTIDWILDANLDDMPKGLQAQMLKEKGLTSRRIYEVLLSKQIQEKPRVQVSIATLNISESAAKVLLDRVPEIIDVTPKKEPSE